MSSATPVPVAPVAGVSAARLVGRRVTDWIPAAIVLVASLAAWEGVVRGFHVQRFLLPAPTTIWTSFVHNQNALWHEGWFTLQEALGGFVIGTLLAVALAAVVARWNVLGSALMPFAVAANAIPIIAFAPITNTWFNPLTKSSKMAVAAVLCFFPVFVNVVRGLRSVKPQQVELMRSYAVSDFAVFRLVRVPTALPFLFASLKVACVLAMIGAIVGEYFGGSLEALGANIKQDASLFQFEKAWAEIVVACLLGIAFYLAVTLLERIVMRWQPRAELGG